MITIFDRRPMEEIANELLSTPEEDINLLAICIILCDRIAQLEDKITNNKLVDVVGISDQETGKISL